MRPIKEHPDYDRAPIEEILRPLSAECPPINSSYIGTTSQIGPESLGRRAGQAAAIASKLGWMRRRLGIKGIRNDPDRERGR